MFFKSQFGNNFYFYRKLLLVCNRTVLVTHILCDVVNARPRFAKRPQTLRCWACAGYVIFGGRLLVRFFTSAILSLPALWFMDTAL